MSGQRPSERSARGKNQPATAEIPAIAPASARARFRFRRLFSGVISIVMSSWQEGLLRFPQRASAICDPPQSRGFLHRMIYYHGQEEAHGSVRWVELSSLDCAPGRVIASPERRGVELAGAASDRNSTSTRRMLASFV